MREVYNLFQIEHVHNNDGDDLLPPKLPKPPSSFIIYFCSNSACSVYILFVRLSTEEFLDGTKDGSNESFSDLIVLI